MKRISLLFLSGFVLAFVFSLDICAGTLTSTVDNAHVTVNEPFSLTVEYDSSVDDDQEPNVGQLQQNFVILSRNRSSSYQIINGKMSSTTTWNYEMLAKQSGTFLIPSFRINNDFSEAITIEAKDIPNNATSSNNTIYTETELDQDTVHVQEQAIITWRVVSGANISNPALAPPQIENVLTQNLGHREYQRAGKDGKVENVIEQRFALFPQQSGTVEIPAQNIQVNANSHQYSGMGIIHPSVTQIMLATKAQTLRVQPAESNAQQNWLPARKLQVSQELLGLDSNHQATAGSAFTRVIRIRAEGVSAEQLPPVEFNAPDFRVYSEKPQMKNDVDTNGVIGTREEHAAMIATRDGTLSLPEIRVPWYNTGTSTWEEAVLPATTVNVLPADGHTVNTTTAPAQSAADKNPAPEHTAAPAAIPPDNPAPVTTDATHRTLRLWQGAAVALLLLWLGSMGWIWYNKRQQSTANNPDGITPAVRRKPEHVYHKALEDAATAADVKMLQQEILRWARQQWPTDTPISLSAVADRLDNPELAGQLRALERHIYGDGPAPTGLPQLASALLTHGKQADTHKPAASRQLGDLYQ